MQVVDTSIWIEVARASLVGAKAQSVFPTEDRCIVPTMVQFELVKWFRREVSSDAADAIMALTEQCVVIDFDSRLAAMAADIAATHRLSAADAIIYATAVSTGAELVTCDAHFEGLPGVRYFPAKGA